MKSYHLLAVFGTTGLVLFGCGGRTVIHEQPVVVKESAQPVIVKESAQPIIVQSDTMPPPREERPGPPPGSEDVWVAGHWEKTERGWLWREGHWERRG